MAVLIVVLASFSAIGDVSTGGGGGGEGTVNCDRNNPQWGTQATIDCTQYLQPQGYACDLDCLMTKTSTGSSCGSGTLKNCANSTINEPYYYQSGTCSPNDGGNPLCLCSYGNTGWDTSATTVPVPTCSAS